MAPSARQGRRWRVRAVFNSIGPPRPALVLVITRVTKFTHGALDRDRGGSSAHRVVPRGHRHYQVCPGAPRRRVVEPHTPRNSVVLLVGDVGPATIEALGTYGRSDHAVPRGPAPVERIRLRAGRAVARPHGRRSDLEPLPATGRPRPRLRTPRWDRAGIGRLRHGGCSRPERTAIDDGRPSPSPGYPTQGRLLRERRIAVADVPVVLSKGVPVGVDALAARPAADLASFSSPGSTMPRLRAINYARSLGAMDTRAVFFALDPAESGRIAEEWVERGLRSPSRLTEAPSRPGRTDAG